MMSAKRTRPPMKRNTSMTEFTLDFSICPDQYQTLDQYPFNAGGLDQRSTVRPLHRRNSSDIVETNAAADQQYFLRICSLCKHRLIPGYDIYMYRGDRAFCSLECRQQQLTQDERKEKSCSFTSKKEPSSTTAARAKVSASSAGGSVTAV
ncbi:hypothetical protein ACJIZ3_003233 [Penstemon smallii]|uniref:FLZ-type domain-containing protein n=1 Tax=Penstemon smallii TaxID=265156 RepID=A0ABD3UBQ2_9LAMI